MNIMKGPFAIVAFVIFNIFISDCEGAVYGLRNVLDPNGPNCEKLFNLLQKFHSKIREVNPRNYASFDKRFKMLFGINFTDTAAVKERACQIVGTKTLRDLSTLIPGIPYDELLTAYKLYQETVAWKGGYTAAWINFNTNVDFYNFLWDATENVPNAKAVSEVIDLPTLTRILEVMQVRYGSRWIDSLFSEHEYGLVKDPKKLAEELYGSASFDDFKIRLSAATETTDDVQKGFYVMFLNAHEYRAQIEFHLEIVSKSRAAFNDLLGNLGLLTLEY